MRSGVSCAVAVVIVLGTLPVVPLLYPGGATASASPLINPDEVLYVTDRYELTGYEVWREVRVETTGALLVTEGGRLVTDSIQLHGNAMFSVLGGVVEVTPTAHRQVASISGTCAYFEVEDNSVVRVWGPDGGYDVATSMGTSAVLNVTANWYIEVLDSTLDLRAGDGLSAPEPLSLDDLDGDAFSGGNVELSLVCKSPYELLHLSSATVRLRAGAGGDAPDAEGPPADPEGRIKGLGGGYTRGGDVSGRVGAGGDVTIGIDGEFVELANTQVNVTAGRGGDAGDGASVGQDVLAGAGGGGYSGGDGASGLVEHFPSLPGGDVSGNVGRGGDVDILIMSNRLDLHTAGFDVRGGDGGDAGNGGSSRGQGGGGGGGYSGGGGGSHNHMEGADGGTVTGQVGRGGHVTMEVDAKEHMEVKSSRILLHAGTGGDGGNGGDGGRDGGGGGGGYSAGGGGGGDVVAQTVGRDGGDGAPVSGQVAMGGSASLLMSSERLITMFSAHGIRGGDAGTMGLPGATHVLPSGSPGGGGGAGGHSAGGGAGAGQDGVMANGGRAGEVTDEVCDGGDASFVIESERPSVHRNTAEDATAGFRGPVVEASAGGQTGGLGVVRDPDDGSLHRSIPKSMTIHYAPADSEYLTYPPRFDWMPLYLSTTDGDVDHYLFILSRDNTFTDIVVSQELDHPGWFDPELPMGTYYWRVTAVYQGPPTAAGPEPGFSWFRYFNAPPVIKADPTVDVVEGVFKSTYLGNVIHDPDTPLQDLCLTCEHPGVSSVTGLFVTLFYRTHQPDHVIKYNVSDGTSTVMGVMNVRITEANQRPTIHDVGGHVPPILIWVKEGSVEYLEVNATDPNGDVLEFSLQGQWPAANISRLGTLRISPTKDDIGLNSVSVVAKDPHGEQDRVHVRFRVTNALEPPAPPEIFGPENGSRWKEGERITFTVRVHDPDIIHGETLTVTWESNVSGLIGSDGSTDVASTSTTSLPPGNHRVYITISDGTFESNGYVDITVVDTEDPLPPPEPSDLGLYILFALVFIIMIAIGFYAGSRGAADEMD